MTEGIATSHSIEKKKIKKKNGNMSSNMCVHTHMTISKAPGVIKGIFFPFLSFSSPSVLTVSL